MRDLGAPRSQPSRVWVVSCWRAALHARKFRVPAALGLLWLWLAGAARAEDVLDIPPSCGSQSELTREIDALRAREASDAPRPEVRLAPEQAGYVLEIALPEGTRTLRDPDCRALFRAAIVIAALGHEWGVGSTDASSSPPEVHPSSAPAPAPVATPSPTVPSAATSPPTAAPPSSRRRSRPRVSTRSSATEAQQGTAFLQVEVTHGVVPAWSAALSAGAAWRRGLWGVRGWFGYLTPNTEREGQAEVHIQALDLAASLELWPLQGLGLGLGAELFLLRGQGLGVSRSRVDWTAQPAPHLALRARIWRGTRGLVELTGRAVWSPQPSRFRLESGDTLYRAEAFAFQLGLAGSLQFL